MSQSYKAAHSHKAGQSSQSGQMTASIASDHAKDRKSTPFAPLGLPAVMAAAEILKPKKPADRPAHLDFFIRGDD
jgi:hypothetical protein